MILFYLLVAVMPIVRHAIWSETLIAGMTLYKWLGLVCLSLALITLPSRRTPPRFFATPQAWLFLAFALEITISFLTMSRASQLEDSPVSSFSAFVMFFFVTMILVDSLDRLRWTLLAMVGGLAYTSLHLIREWQAYGGMAAGVRPYWVVGDPNYFALTALFGLPVGVLLAQQRSPWWQRPFCWGCVAVTLFAFTLAGSRGGFLGLIVAAAALGWRSRRRLRNFVAGGLIIGLLFAFSPTSPLERFLNPASTDQASVDTREALFWAGLDIFKENLWTGIGAMNFKRAVTAYQLDDTTALANVAHNTYVEVAAELGVFGLLTLLAILLFSFRTVQQLRVATRNHDDMLLHITAAGLEAGLLGGVVAIFFLSALHVRYLWFMVTLTACLPSLTPKVRQLVSAPAATEVIRVG